MSTTRTAPHDPATRTMPSRQRPRHPARTALVILGTLVATMMALMAAADVAMSSMGAHLHGTLDIIIDGEAVDLDQPRFHDLHPTFHVHAGHGNRWHHHPQSVTGIVGFEPLTLAEALAAMGAELTDDRFAFDGTVRTDATVTVNGRTVDPDGHVITDGDTIVVAVAEPR